MPSLVGLSLDDVDATLFAKEFGGWEVVKDCLKGWVGELESDFIQFKIIRNKIEIVFHKRLKIMPALKL